MNLKPEQYMWLAVVRPRPLAGVQVSWPSATTCPPRRSSVFRHYEMKIESAVPPPYILGFPLPRGPPTTSESCTFPASFLPSARGRDRISFIYFRQWERAGTWRSAFCPFKKLPILKVDLVEWLREKDLGRKNGDFLSPFAVVNGWRNAVRSILSM